MKTNCAAHLEDLPPIYKEGGQTARARVFAMRIAEAKKAGVAIPKAKEEWWNVWERVRGLRKSSRSVKVEVNESGAQVDLGGGMGDEPKEVDDNAPTEIAALDIISRNKVKSLAELRKGSSDAMALVAAVLEHEAETRRDDKKHYEANLSLVSKSASEANAWLMKVVSRLVEGQVKLLEVRSKTVERADRFALRYMKKMKKLQQELDAAADAAKPDVLERIGELFARAYPKLEPHLPMIAAFLAQKFQKPT